MEWWGISGSWRLTSKQVETDVRAAVRDVLLAGDGIVSGGALNVDFFATDEALKLCPTGERIKIFIPTPLDIYARHYRNRAAEGVITTDQAEKLIHQLTIVQQAGALTEMTFDRCDQGTYFARNARVVDASTALLAFHVNGSAGVQDTVDKAQGLGKRTIVKTYTL